MIRRAAMNLCQHLPQGKVGGLNISFITYWLSNRALAGLLLVQHNFKPQPSDIFLATTPKCGSTWLRALLFSIVNRSRYDFTSHPLLNTPPRECFPFLGFLLPPKQTHF
ncbi:hypothetical protein COLO4_27482 [Corchorus olitorius]|uniref:Sulfotransferase n=1 Tax=Corchorus olitorius TaxID=93759 RepID=A0A1R3HQW7_9ROSI|nr:hypothetical protein COLO4_27482 [Corchorus olitorius]